MNTLTIDTSTIVASVAILNEENNLHTKNPIIHNFVFKQILRFSGLVNNFITTLQFTNKGCKQTKKVCDEISIWRRNLQNFRENWTF